MAKGIGRNFFKVSGRIDENHVRATFGSAAQNCDAEQIKLLIEEIERHRKDCQNWGYSYVESRLVQNLQNHGVPVNNWREAISFFAKDAEGRWLLRYWAACYGVWDKHPGWPEDVADSYLSARSYQYIESREEGGIGCCARMMSACKNERVKQLNKAARKTHGNEIRLKRKSDEITDATRNAQRKKGLPHPDACFGKVGGVPMSDWKAMDEETKARIAKEKVMDSEMEEATEPPAMEGDANLLLGELIDSPRRDQMSLMRKELDGLKVRDKDLMA